MPLETFEPPKAYEPKNKNTLTSERHNIVEPKLDGIRGIVHCTLDGVFLLSRNKNKDGQYSQFQDNVPHLRDHKYLITLGSKGYTILDCEILAPVNNDTLGNTMSIVGSLPEKAIQVQQKLGKAYITLFDIPRFKGQDLTKKSWTERRKILDTLKTDDYIKHIPFTIVNTLQDKQKIFKEYIDAGYEGIVLKDPNSLYHDSRAWLKHKERTTIDAQIIGWIPGKGKYSNSIGALKTALLDSNNNLKFFCTVSPGTDNTRKELYEQFRNLTTEQIINLNLIIEIEGQSLNSANHSMRHPRILRYREDKKSPNRYP